MFSPMSFELIRIHPAASAGWPSCWKGSSGGTAARQVTGWAVEMVKGDGAGPWIWREPTRGEEWPGFGGLGGTAHGIPDREERSKGSRKTAGRSCGFREGEDRGGHFGARSRECI